MKKILLTGIVIIMFFLYSIIHSASVIPMMSTKNNGSGTTVSIAGTGTMQGSYKDGTYTGSAADAFYGLIQVQATIQNGKITNVKFLQAPSDRSESVQINQQADPMLAQEAIQAQSASVNIISGATDSSQAFMQSLASALSQAK